MFATNPGEPHRTVKYNPTFQGKFEQPSGLLKSPGGFSCNSGKLPVDRNTGIVPRRRLLSRRGAPEICRFIRAILTRKRLRPADGYW
jgi:hypothetical protein